uniref:leucine-rich repeat domain-containing protein n=1 Tax=Prevotella sp. TaxID=59823 RepID=UPI004026CBF7
MKNFTFKRQLLFVMFMLLGCLSIQAADDGLITKQITIKLDEAGTLPNRIGGSKKYLITNLKIVGEVNGTDWLFIREMAGSDLCGDKTGGKLSILDLSDAKIVKGGSEYVFFGYDSSRRYTSNDKLGDYAFYGCSGLTSLTIPSSVTSIGGEAFRDCSGLTSLTIPSSVTSIGDYAFFGCSSLTSLTIPSSVTSIGNNAFYGCSSLTSLTIPSSVTSIGYAAFSDCSSLTSLTIPSSVTSIGEAAFYGCSSLTSLTIPSGVTSIGEAAFSGCSGLTSLTIPSSVTSIGNYALKGCSGLTSIYVYPEKLPKLGEKVFDGCNAKNCKVYVPTGTYDDYWLSEFGYFENIVEFDATGIDKVTISTDAKELSRYSVNGQRLFAPVKGLNIVKYSDGSVKKVVVQ